MTTSEYPVLYVFVVLYFFIVPFPLFSFIFYLRVFFLLHWLLYSFSTPVLARMYAPDAHIHGTKQKRRYLPQLVNGPGGRKLIEVDREALLVFGIWLATFTPLK